MPPISRCFVGCTIFLAGESGDRSKSWSKWLFVISLGEAMGQDVPKSKRTNQIRDSRRISKDDLSLLAKSSEDFQRT